MCQLNVNRRFGNLKHNMYISIQDEPDVLFLGKYIYLYMEMEQHTKGKELFSTVSLFYHSFYAEVLPFNFL